MLRAVFPCLAAAGARGIVAEEEEKLLRLRETRESEAQRELQVRAEHRDMTGAVYPAAGALAVSTWRPPQHAALGKPIRAALCL